LLTPDAKALAEFVTAAVLATGQNYAPLLPPITHEGHAVVWQSLSPDATTILTLGTDGTSRLWDTATGKHLSILQRENERVMDCGFSPDGKTIFTDDQASIARFWDGTDGRFVAGTEVRANRYQFPKSWSLETIEEQIRPKYRKDRNQKSQFRDAVQLGNGRALTNGTVSKLIGEDRGADSSIQTTRQARSELWNTSTGQLIGGFEGWSHLVGNGRYVLLYIEPGLVVYSATDGQEVVRFNENNGLTPSGVYSSSRWIAEYHLGQQGSTNPYFKVRDSNKWDSPPFIMKCPVDGSSSDWSGYSDQIQITDQLLIKRKAFNILAGRPGFDSTLRQFYDHSNLGRTIDVVLRDEEIYTGNGLVFNTKAWQRRFPDGAKKYPSNLGRFSKNGRFVNAVIDDKYFAIDTVADKQFPCAGNWSTLNKAGNDCLVRIRMSNQNTARHESSVEICLIPTSRLSEIPPVILQHWVQLLVRGEFEANGQFKKWDEATWQQKRQELAAVPPPIPNFPFPGQVCNDINYWLRTEFGEAVNRANPFIAGVQQKLAAKEQQLRLATELLRRAEESGEKTEAVRWLAEVAKQTRKLAPMPREKK